MKVMNNIKNYFSNGNGVPWKSLSFQVQVDLVIRGFFIREFAYSHLKNWFKSQNVSFYLRIQYSQSKLAGRIYRE